MIVIKDNPASEFYANYCTKTWEAYGIEVKRFDAITPKDLINHDDIMWKEYSTQDKYKKRNLKVPISETEKACFTSHYSLWKKSAEINKPILVLEHDAYLETPQNLWFDEKFGMIYFDKGAMGSYVIMPWFAKLLMKVIKKNTVSCGPYGFIYGFARRHNLLDKYVNDMHKLFTPASNQVMSKKYGNTIEHYYNSDPELVSEFGLHRFIMI